MVPADGPVDPREWLRARGWHQHFDKAGNEYWRTTPNEPGWTGGWNLAGAVGMELQAAEKRLLQRMGLWEPPTRRRARR